MKKYSAENEFLKITVQETGAELCSLVNKETGMEHIWQADPKVWPSHAPNLFPVIGVLKEGKYKYEGREYEMPKHGFVRYNENVRLKEKAEDQLVFELIYSEESLKIYPFKFDFRISFKLTAKSLEIDHKVINLDSKPIYFSLGGHPAFNICLFEGEEISDYLIEFDQNMDLEKFILNNEGLVSHKTEPVLNKDRKIRLTKKTFNNDALIFKDIPSKKADLLSRKNGKILSVEYKDFTNLGIWAKPGAHYVCIEPWLGIADVEKTDQKLKNKEGIIQLMPAKEFNASYSINLA
ncbi:aldose 1-epimerase family protein [Gramella jeungdoensis]|uniref:Aldose 1-epimerase family protein n=1 Tax=Gramella jeungdoensis TaxID=708091 RepID=A0ABT0YY70_9FLAO|nr:aldose 1-epimerase family protein [Gramella jeungdoensis]MCM8568284.1 aldose 1-epimerase family protein [Gramella jeungdoensis]